MKYWALLFVAVGILMDIRKNRTKQTIPIILLHMRGLLTVLIIMFFHLSMAAQTQSGVVKTRGRMIDGNYVPGKACQEL